MARELSFVQSVERSISKTYRERLWTPFITAIKNYKLIEEGDKIAVCIETFPGYKAGGELHSFIEDYENRKPQKG